MTDWRVRLATRWTGDGSDEDSNRPQFGDDYTFIRWTDVTAQTMNQPGKRPKPNTYIIEAEITDTVLTQLEGDNQYLIFSTEELIDNGAP